MRQEQLELRAQLDRLLSQEEAKWKQRGKIKEILQGDSNTKYLHAKANGRRRKNMITALNQAEGLITEEKEIVDYITNFYKNLFGQPDCNSIVLQIENPELVPNSDIGKLTEPFTEKEVKEVVFKMAHNKSPGPDGFNVEFYQHFWELIKTDLMNLFEDFHNGKLNISRLNYGVITLIPKMQGADQIQKFRPICLLNVSFKIFTKVLMNRLVGVADKIILPTQTAFIKGRVIMDGVLILHEALNSIHVEKSNALIFKVDFEKTYDKIKWAFVLQRMRLKGFPENGLIGLCKQLEEAR